MGKIIWNAWIVMVVLMTMAQANFDGVYAGARCLVPECDGLD